MKKLEVSANQMIEVATPNPSAGLIHSPKLHCHQIIVVNCHWYHVSVCSFNIWSFPNRSHFLQGNLTIGHLGLSWAGSLSSTLSLGASLYLGILSGILWHSSVTETVYMVQAVQKREYQCDLLAIRCSVQPRYTWPHILDMVPRFNLADNFISRQLMEHDFMCFI